MDSIEHLLHCCFWSQDSLIQHYIDHPMTLRKETGLTGDPAIPPPAKGAELACPICLLVVPTSDMLWLWCNHACCKVSVVSPSLYLSSSTAHPHPLTPHTSPPPPTTHTHSCVGSLILLLKYTSTKLSFVLVRFTAAMHVPQGPSS